MFNWQVLKQWNMLMLMISCVEKFGSIVEIISTIYWHHRVKNFWQHHDFCRCWCQESASLCFNIWYDQIILASKPYLFHSHVTRWSYVSHILFQSLLHFLIAHSTPLRTRCCWADKCCCCVQKGGTKLGSETRFATWYLCVLRGPPQLGVVLFVSSIALGAWKFDS